MISRIMEIGRAVIRRGKHPPRSDYPMDNSCQTKYILIWKWNGLNFGWTIHLTYPSVFPLILTDFEDGLSVSCVKTALQVTL